MLAEYFQDKEGYAQIVDDVPRIIRNRAITYAEGFDKICFVVDRDRESFVAHEENNQYKYVLEKCRENGFGLYLTNPCFEELRVAFSLLQPANKKSILKLKKVKKLYRLKIRH